MATVEMTIRRAGMDGHSYPFEMETFTPATASAPLATLTCPLAVPTSLLVHLREADGTYWKVLHSVDNHPAGRRELIARQEAPE